MGSAVWRFGWDGRSGAVSREGPAAPLREDRRFWVSQSLQECFRGLGYVVGDFPEAERAAGETVALPMYRELTLEQQAYVFRTIRAYYADRHAAGGARG